MSGVECRKAGGEIGKKLLSALLPVVPDIRSTIQQTLLSTECTTRHVSTVLPRCTPVTAVHFTTPETCLQS